jgi:hypothetical protein
MASWLTCCVVLLWYATLVAADAELAPSAAADSTPAVIAAVGGRRI